MQVYVVAVTCPEPELAYRVFHTLNAKDRGVDLSIIDMLKSHIFEGLKSEEIGEGEKWKETRTAQGEKWQELETKLGRDEFEKLFLYVQKIDQVSFWSDFLPLFWSLFGVKYVSPREELQAWGIWVFQVLIGRKLG